MLLFFHVASQKLGSKTSVDFGSGPVTRRGCSKMKALSGILKISG